MVVLTEQMNSPHGTQMLASLVMDQAVKAGFEVVLFTPQYDSARSYWREFLESRGIRVFSAGFWRMTRWYLPHRVLARRFWRFVDEFEPDLIWAPDNEPFTCCALELSPDPAPPFFVHDPNEASPAFDTYPDMWFSVCNRVHALSVHGRRQMRSAREYYALEKPIGVVWPASLVPERESCPYPDGPTIQFGQLGRLHRHKSVATSINAIAAVRSKGYSAHLHIFGSGPEEERLRALSSRLDLNGHVFFHGEYDWQEIDSCIQMIHVGLLPSLCEGFGLVILEMLSRGRPVIASDVGSTREVLEEMGGGWVFPIGDESALVGMMEAVCANPAMIEEQGRRGREIWREHFTPQMMFQRYLAFWRECGARV